MNSLALGFLYIMAHAEHETIRGYAENGYLRLRNEGESEEIAEMYGRVRKAFELEECYNALFYNQQRAVAASKEIINIRTLLLKQIYDLMG